MNKLSGKKTYVISTVVVLAVRDDPACTAVVSLNATYGTRV